MLLKTGGLLYSWGALVSHTQLTAYSTFCRATRHTISPSRYCCKDLFLPMHRTSHVPLLNFIRFLLTHSCNLSRTLWMMVLPSNISTGVPYLLSSVKFTNTSPIYLLLINTLNKTCPRTCPLQYFTSIWPLATVARIIKSCLEMYSKAHQWHETLLSEFWASRSRYKLGQLKATKVLRQCKGISEVLQSSFVFLMQAGCNDIRAGRSWFAHVQVVSRPPFSIITVQETTMTSRPIQWLLFAFLEFTSYSWR